MTHNTTWKTLEDLMLELKKKGVTIPTTVINDLRSAKLTIKISESADSNGDISQKVEEDLRSVESFLINEAHKTLDSESVDQWLRRLGNGAVETIGAKTEETKFITNVPRDQKWVRIEPITNLTHKRIMQIAKESNLSVNPQKDGRLVVYGQQDGIKEFLKKITAETTKK